MTTPEELFAFILPHNRLLVFGLFKMWLSTIAMQGWMWLRITS